MTLSVVIKILNKDKTQFVAHEYTADELFFSNLTDEGRKSLCLKLARAVESVVVEEFKNQV